MSAEKTTPEENVDSPASPVEEGKAAEVKNAAPIRFWTGAAVALCIAIFVGHVLADKYTPIPVTAGFRPLLCL